jgi:hypothetical protein
MLQLGAGCGEFVLQRRRTPQRDRFDGQFTGTIQIAELPGKASMKHRLAGSECGLACAAFGDPGVGTLGLSRRFRPTPELS